jgi:hypothetical protein
MIATFLIPTDPRPVINERNHSEFRMALPPMLWPLNSAPTQVAVNGSAEAADRAEYCQAAGLTDKALICEAKL